MASSDNEGMDNKEELEAVLYYGGSWKKKDHGSGFNMEYIAKKGKIQKHALKLPLQNLTYSVLADHVFTALGPNVDRKKVNLTYPHVMAPHTIFELEPELKFLPVDLEDDRELKNFLQNVPNAETVELYVCPK